MVHDVIVALSIGGVIGMVLIGYLLIVGALHLVGVRGPLAATRELIWGYELWLALLVSGAGMAGSLYLSEAANFLPCELCWYQRIFLYPVAILSLLMALANDHRAARYLLPLPVIGFGFAFYHLLVENPGSSRPRPVSPPHRAAARRSGSTSSGS
jgi:hypothetical protein